MTATADRRRVDGEILRAWLGADRVTFEPAPSTGWSAETVVFEADGTRLVLRAAPRSSGMFAEHDLATQVLCMRHVRAHGLPAPAIVAADLAGEHLGRPAYVMEFVAGRVPPDGRPSFTRAGFLYEAMPGQQRIFGEDLVDRIAALHRLPALDLPLGPAAADHVAWLAARTTEVGALAPPVTEDVTARAVEILGATAPEPVGPPVLLWGDGRPSNTVVDDGFRVAAMLDWELAGTGDPELDVAWLNEMNRMRAAEVVDPVLPGLPTEREVWQRWSAGTGRNPRALSWFRLQAACRIAILMDLHLAERVRHGVLAPDAPVRSDNRARRRVTELLDQLPS